MAGHRRQGPTPAGAGDEQPFLETLAVRYRGALNRMAAHSKLGGWLAIGDAKRSSRLLGRPFNWLADLLGYGAAEDMTRRPWELLGEMLDNFLFERCIPQELRETIEIIVARDGLNRFRSTFRVVPGQIRE